MDMRELIELIKLLNIERLQANGLWNIVFERDSKMEQLCEAIASGQVTNDEEGAQLLYGSKTAGTKYLNLKERLKERLINSVFLLEFRSTGFSTRHKAYFECNRKWAAVMVLLTRNAKLTGIDVLESLLRHAQYFEFTELTMNILSILRLHYGTIQGDQHKYNQYRDAYRHHQQVWMMENEAEEMYTHLVSHFVNSKATKTEIADKAQAYFDQVAPMMEASDSFRLHLCGRLIQTTIHSSRNDYATTASVCEEAIAFFKKKEFDSNLPLQAFYYQLGDRPDRGDRKILQPLPDPGRHLSQQLLHQTAFTNSRRFIPPGGCAPKIGIISQTTAFCSAGGRLPNA